MDLSNFKLWDALNKEVAEKTGETTMDLQILRDAGHITNDQFETYRQALIQIADLFARQASYTRPKK